MFKSTRCYSSGEVFKNTLRQDVFKESAQILFDRMNAADGSKLKKTVTDGATNKTVDYLGGFQYRNALLDFFPTTSAPHSAGSEGYVRSVPIGIGGNPHYSFHYVYNYTDHLGNIRVRYTKDPQTGTIKPLEENHYYPFACPVRSFRGLKHQGYNHEHQVFEFDQIEGNVALITIPQNATDGYNYKYQGQERQDEFNLNWDSFKWRNYDYAIGRFMSIDPLSVSIPPTISRIIR